MKLVIKLQLLVLIFISSNSLLAQELYVENSAASTVNETNSLGGLALFSGNPTVSVSNQSDTGTYSFLLENTNSVTYARHKLQIPVENGVEVRVIIKFKTENVAGTGYGDGFVWVEDGITTNTWTPSTQVGWQIFDEVVLTNSTTLGLSFGTTQTVTTMDKIWVDEVSVQKVDTQTPTAPILSSSAQTDSSVALSWTAATDNTAVTGYKVYKGAVLETTLGNVLSYQVTGLTASTAYNFTVTALDAAGNESVVSNTVGTTTNNAIVGNLLDTSTWTVGTGSVSGFNRTGVDAENIREMGIGPHGSTVLLWKGITDGTATNDDGGWVSSIIIDPSKTYRCTVWMKKTNSNDGHTSFGVQAKENSGNWALSSLQDVTLTYASFHNGGMPALDNWYLFVGYIHDNTFTGTTSIGGVYDGATGTKILDLTDKKFQSTASELINKLMLHRGTPNIADALYFYDPTIYEVNGQEPTIQELIDGPLDTQAPTAPTLSSASQTDTTVDLSWTAATDNTAVTGYKVYKDAILETTLGNVLSYQVTGLTASTAYNFTVTALDAAGNESVVSNTVGTTTNNAIVGNLLDTSTWTVGTGSVSGFNHVGTDLVNVREQDTGPHGTSELLWKRASGVSSTSSGGLITDYVNIDPSKTYRFTVWAKKSNSQDGRYYFAFDAKNSSGNFATNYLISGNPINSPYFKVGDLPTLDNWYLFVSSVHPSGHTGTTHTGGLYDINGVKVSVTNDFKFQSGAIQTRFKMYFYEQTNINDHVHLYSPTIYEVNGQEPTIQELIDGPPDTQAPTASTLSSTAQTDTTADLSWTVATDNIAVTGYKVYKDAVLETTLGNVLSSQVTGLTASTAYNFTVTVLDAAGNESVVSNTLAITTNAASSNNYASEYQAILDEATTQGYTLPSTADQDLQNQIILSVKASGVWAKSDLILYFKGSGDKNFKLINWKSPTGLKATEESYGGALTWSSTGVKGDGLAVINTHFDLTSGGLNYAQNNAGFYIEVSQAYTTKYNLFGGDNVALSTAFQRPLINSDGSLPPVFTFPGTGLLGVSRNNATSYIASVGSILTTLTQNSGSVTNQELKVLGFGNGTSIGVRFDGEVTYTIVGGDMSDKLSDIETAFNTSSNDTQAPTASTLSSTAQTDTTVDLSWTAATDNTAVTGYKVYKDAVLETTLGNVLSYQVTGLTASTAYNFTVTALDAAGNESVVSNTLAITTNAQTDSQAPTAPTLSSTVQTDTTADLSWTAATDNTGVTGYKVYKDTVLETTLGNVLSYQVTGLTSATAYNFTVTALDAAGNESVVSNTLAITTNVASGGGSGNWTLNNQNVYYNTGNVGIGTTTPDEKLAVNGNIHAKEVRVDLSGWPDYVFTKDHDLPTLKQVENYIKKKGHLPNIPSAKEVEENGIQLGDMNAKLLEKIEELTLYIIQQQKLIEAQSKTIDLVLEKQKSKQ